MAGRDFYDILGVSRAASDDEIRKAYRRSAKRYHPDRNAGDASAEAKFKSIQEAYEVLSDKSKRAQYDQFGRAGVGQFVDTGRGKEYAWGGGSHINVDELEDLFAAFGQGGQGGDRASIFDQFLGGGRRRQNAAAAARATAGRRPSRRGQDVERRVRLTFEQAVRGATVAIDRSVTGKKHESLSVKIPPNVQNDQRIRLRGQGVPGRGGPAGDLYIVCDVAPHPYFRREGWDILVDVPLSVTEALMGCKVDVPTLHGVMTVTFPPCMSSGAKLRLRGKGAVAEGRAPGDQHVVVRIVTPSELSEAQMLAAGKLAEELTEDPRSGVAWGKSEATA